MSERWPLVVKRWPYQNEKIFNLKYILEKKKRKNFACQDSNPRHKTVIMSVVVTLVNGAQNGTNIIAGRPIASHAILRTTASLVTEELQNVAAAQVSGNQAVVEAITSDTNNLLRTLNQSLDATMYKQRQVMVICALVPISIFGLIYLVKSPHIQNASAAVVETALEKLPSKEYIAGIVKSELPSKEYIAETIKTELAARTPVIKPAILSVTAQQILVVGGTGILFGGALVILVLKLNENDKLNLKKVV